MGFDGASAAGGAASGAAMGTQIAPGWGTAIGGVLGGVAGGLLGKKKKKGPDLSGLINTINESGTKQRNLITSVRPQTTAMGNQFKTDVTGRGQQFVNDAGDSSGALAEAEFQAGKRRLLEGEGQKTQALRESIAASGGAGRGGQMLTAQKEQNQELGRNLGNLTSDVAIQNLRSKQDAVSRVFGVDANVIEELYKNGRGDLLDEMNALLQEEQSRTGNIVGIQGKQIDNNYAAGLANDRQSQGLTDSIIGSLGSIAGTYAQNNKNKEEMEMLNKLYGIG